MDTIEPTDLSEARLRETLGTRAFQFYSQIGSTNDEALAWLANSAPNGSVIVADEQIKGRGRLGRSWFAPPGTALMFSYLLRPLAEELTCVGMAGALAVCETVAAFEPSLAVGIKWPNDVQIGGRKLCGVLPEAAWQGEQLVGVALGIGVNIRIDFSDSSFAETAVSLETVSRSLARAELLASLLERLDYWSARLASDELFEAWRSRLVTLGQQVSVNSNGATISGTAKDVERSGALIIDDNRGALRRVIAGDIALG
jgi:BirA family biotin operon repressor/biotin-[acetyl-CoA-carboxylase] ligase